MTEGNVDRRRPDLRSRPLLGGIFGSGRYTLASMPCIVNGLHAIRFMVFDPAAGAVLSIADEKVDALRAARTILRLNAQQAALEAGHAGQLTLWPILSSKTSSRRRPVSKRRRDIYAKCEGCCHYCSGPLQLDGVWHIEHMLPKALGGQDEASNLVAACAPCNLKKRDRTAIEFVASANGANLR